MAVQTLHLEHISPEIALYIALFSNVTNGEFLKQQLLDGNADFEYAFIDASTIVSTTHVLAATYRALVDLSNKRLKTRNIHSEIVFSLSPNNNIAESFRRFGVSDSTTGLLAIKVSTSPRITLDIVERHLDDVVNGTAISFTDQSIAAMTDLTKVNKIYKLGLGNELKVIDSTAEGINAEATTIVDLRRKAEVGIVASMALRGAT
ncbi:MAG: hypothetical protein M1825_002856 [Sarcosagium campestre]|nr:MAG: hypothetical protein M1825_002856 [Sarcosagium campestre]